jgi:hypothetical protein
MVEGRRPYELRLCKTRPSPFGRLAGPWVNFEWLLKCRYEICTAQDMPAVCSIQNTVGRPGTFAHPTSNSITN